MENREQLMNGRYFSGRKLECFYYDGKTNYEKKVSVEEEEKRIGLFIFDYFFTIYYLYVFLCFIQIIAFFIN